MSKIIDYLYEVGLTSVDKVRDYFLTNDMDTILSLEEYVGDLAFEDWSIAEYSPYSFAPSMDVSGFGGCAEINCKIRRASKFVRFSSLYSDSVYLIVNSITNPHPVQIEEDESHRWGVINDYSLILLYADLLQANIARVIPAHFSVCPDCFSKHICDLSDFSLIEPLVDEYAAKAILEATEYFRQEDLSFLTLSNLPELFPDHNGYFSYQGGDVSKLCQSAPKFPYRIQDKKLIGDFIREHLFEEFITAKFETFISASYQSKYITTKASDKALIETHTHNITGSTPPPVFEMPFLENISTKDVLDLRHAEGDAFNEYRVAMDNASKQYLSINSNAEAHDIYDDLIYPAFVKLDAAFNRAKRIHAIKNVCALIVASSTVTLGIMNSTIPKDPVAIAAAVGGSDVLLSQLGNVVERKLNSGNELERQDFYFLWKLNKGNK